MAIKFKITEVKNIHFWLHLMLLILCVTASLLWQSIKYCYWKSILILMIEMHSVPAFTVIYFCLILVHVMDKSPGASLCIVFDLIGFSVHLVVAALQLWAYCAQFYVMEMYKKTGENDLLVMNEEEGSCRLNYVFFFNLVISILILVDIMMFLMSDIADDDAGKRSHNIGDNMLDAFQDFHFWLKLAGFILMVFSSLSSMLAPFQCTKPDLWFKMLEMHGAPAFSVILICLLMIYPFGEYPGVFMCLFLDILGAILIGCVAFLQLHETFTTLKSRERDCYFNSTAIINWIIVVILLLDAVIYVAVDLVMGIDQFQRTYNDDNP